MSALRRYGVVSVFAAATLVAVPSALADPGGNGKGGGGGGQQGSGTPDEGDNRHPSGKDRSVEAGGSGTQGRSQSDPDGMTNGGADKPGGSGGIDRADQDGNNGCGNDDDFEDDNNGNCLGRTKDRDEARVAAAVAAARQARLAELCVRIEGMEHGRGPCGPAPGLSVSAAARAAARAKGGAVTGGAVAGRAVTGGAVAPTAQARGGTEVLGVRFTRGAGGRVVVAGVTLPVTGGEVVPLLLAGVTALGAGTGVLAAAKRR